MRLFKRRPVAPSPLADAVHALAQRSVQERAREAQREAYAAGLRDGTLLLIEHMQGRGCGENYSGVLPPELSDWLRTIKRRTEEAT